MRVLVACHPDDESIWFAPEKYDQIVIVFGDFGDHRGSVSGDKRRAALAEHPLKDRIVHLNLPESHYTWDRNNLERKLKYEQNYKDLCEFLKTLEADEVTTHAANGEYDNLDHVLVHYACMDTLDCPVNGADPKINRAIKDVYKKHGCWTWYF